MGKYLLYLNYGGNMLIIFILGLVIGSFLNVCIYRLPLQQSIVFPPSHCQNCQAEVKRYDLIPVLSWLLLHGKCRSCGTNISYIYPLVELLTGVVFVLAYLKIGYSVELIRALVLASFFIVITFIDFEHQLILDKVLIPMALVGVVFNIIINENILSYAQGFNDFFLFQISYLDMLIGLMLGGGLLLLIAVLSNGGMGGGDVKLAAVLGLWLGWEYNITLLLLSFILGGIICSLLLASKIKSRKDYIPFGPFITLAAWVVYLYGNEIINWYWSIMS